MTQDLVSIIIPTWNRAFCLPNAIESAIAQTHPNWEAIIIDDGSTDGTADLVAERFGSEKRVRLISQKNAGVAAARNHGISEAQGDYIAFLDSDDLWEPWKLEVQLACFRKYPEPGMVWTDMTAIDPKGNVVNLKYLRTMYSAYRHFGDHSLFDRHYPIAEVAPQLASVLPGIMLSTGDIFSEMITGNLVHTSTVLLRRERLNQVGRFNVEFTPSGEDFDFHLRTCREGAVGFVDVSSIHYQVGMPDQLTNRSHAVHLATNFLKTIEPVIQQDRQRIHLSQEILNETLAYGHRWLGKELLLTGSNRDARVHFSRSLGWKWSPGVASLYALSLFPSKGIQLLRKLGRPVYRAMRSMAYTVILALSSQLEWTDAICDCVLDS